MREGVSEFWIPIHGNFEVGEYRGKELTASILGCLAIFLTIRERAQQNIDSFSTNNLARIN